MAGQGRWPFRTAWFVPGQPTPVYKSFLWGDRDDAEVTAFTDWYFEAGGGGPVTHDTSGALAGGGAVTSGSAARTRAHDSTGALAGDGGQLAGSAARTREHATSGALQGDGAVTAGSADRQTGGGGPVTHDTSGALAGDGAAVAGSAARTRAHATTGALVGDGAQVVGSAARTGAPVSHDTSGSLAGGGAIIVGTAQIGEAQEGGGGSALKIKRRSLLRAEREEEDLVAMAVPMLVAAFEAGVFNG